ncbi:MAG: hypothetical protein R2827_13615 [Bdellovibrionales bacterium]
MMDLARRWVAQNYLLPHADRILQRRIGNKLFQMREEASLPFMLRKANMTHSLFEQLSWAGREVPYYCELFKKANFKPEDVLSDIQAINSLPLLTKDIILEQGDRMLATITMETIRYSCKTGGSTGKKINVKYDIDAADWSSAVTLYARESIGGHLGAKELHFSSDFPEVPNFKDKFREDVKCFIHNRTNVHSKAFGSSDLLSVWTKIKNCKPYLVHGHPSTMYALAQALNEYGINAKNIIGVYESSGEHLSAKKRKVIKETFDCKVIDRYGLAEFGVVAYQIDSKIEDLLVFENIVYPETVDGELALTALKNKVMPLIRYCTGDRANVIEKANGYFLTELSGRVHDVVEIEGERIPTHYIQDVLDHRVGGIVEFQIVLNSTQKPPKLRICPTDLNALSSIEQKVKNYFPRGLEIEFVKQDQFIRIGDRNKFRYVVDASRTSL